MDNQPKYRSQAESPFFYDGATMRPPVEGTVARGELREDEAFHSGRNAWGFYLAQIPVEETGKLLARGKERYGIYCAPCHGDRGDGESVMKERGGLRSANLLEPRVREMPAGRLFRVITEGSGLMPAYRYPIPPEDRWAIVAYLRQLQGEEAP